MTVQCILTYYTYMEYNFPFFWLYMIWHYIGCVFVYEHRKVMSDSFYYLSYPHPPPFHSFPFVKFKVLLLFPSSSLLGVRICISDWDWLISLSIIFSSSILLPHYVIIPFLFQTEWYSVIMYMYHIFFIHSSVEGHLGWCHSLAVMNWAAINIDVAVSL